jgi:hypothetical protein
MRRVDKIDYEGLRAVLNWSPTGIVVYPTPEGWQVRKDTAVLYGEESGRPRVWRRVDRAIEQLKQIGAREITVQLA